MSSRFKVYNDYKLKLKAYSKKRFDPFCRWERITVPYDGNNYMETTIGQLNFFKWAIESKIIDYIQANYDKLGNVVNGYCRNYKIDPEKFNKDLELIKKTYDKLHESLNLYCKYDN